MTTDLSMMTRALIDLIEKRPAKDPDPALMELAERLPNDLATYTKAFAPRGGDVAVGELWLFAPRDPEIVMDGPGEQKEIGILASGEPIMVWFDANAYQVGVFGFDDMERHESLETLLINEFFKCSERGATFPLTETLPEGFEAAFY